MVPAVEISYTALEVLLQNPDHGMPVGAWSLGCVMMEFLVGKLLFTGKDEVDQLYRIFDVLGVPSKKALLAMKPWVFDVEEIWRGEAASGAATCGLPQPTTPAVPGARELQDESQCVQTSG